MLLYGGIELSGYKTVQCAPGDSPNEELVPYDKDLAYPLEVVSDNTPVIDKRYANIEYQNLAAKLKIRAQEGLKTNSAQGIDRFLDTIIKTISTYLTDHATARLDF